MALDNELVSTKRIFPINFKYGDIEDVDDNGKKILLFMVELFSYNENREYSLFRVTGYRPFFYLELPTNINWNNTNNITDLALQLRDISTVTKRGYNMKIPPRSYKLEWNTKSIYADPRLYPYLKVEFDNKWSLDSFIKVVTDKPFKVDKKIIQVIPRLENEIDFRHDLKMFVDKKIRYGIWIQGECIEVLSESQKISRCQREYIVDCSSLSLLTPDEYNNMPIVYPSIMSIDFEQNSIIRTAFPTAWRPMDRMFMCGITYRPACFQYKNIEFIEPKWESFLLVDTECDDIEGCEVICYRDEKNPDNGEKMVILGMPLFVVKKQVAIIIGHNILGYDFDMSNDRLSNFRNAKWGDVSLIKGYNVKIKSNPFSSKAYSFMKIVELDLPGTMILDTMIISRREEKLRKHTLDFVAKEHLGIGKQDMKPTEMFDLYMLANNPYTPIIERKAIMKKIALYCVGTPDNPGDTYLPIKIFLKKKYWIRMCILSSIIYMPMLWIYTKGMLKRSMSLIYAESRINGMIMTPRTDEITYKFDGGLVREPYKGLHMDVFTQDLVQLYPTITEEKNISMDTLENVNDKEYSYPNIPKEEWNEFIFSKKELMNIIDEVKDNIEDKEKKKIDEDIDKLLKSANVKGDTITIRWWKGRIGLIPGVETKLKKARKEDKDEMKKHEEGSLEHDILDGSQLAKKLTGNALYGFLGFVKKNSNSGSYGCLEAAICVTKRGREINEMITNYVEHDIGMVKVMKDKAEISTIEQVLTVIYGDTDSAFIKVKTITIQGIVYYILPEAWDEKYITIKDDEGIIRRVIPRSAWKLMGNWQAKMINKLLPSPHRIEFEKAFLVLLLKMKKHYCGVLFDDKVLGIDPEWNSNMNLKVPIGFDVSRVVYEEVKLFTRGMAIVRREDCIAILNSIEQVIRQILKNAGNLAGIVNVVRSSIIKFLEGPPFEQLKMSMSVAKNYSDKCYHPNKKFTKYLSQEEGRNLTPGGRLESVFIEVEGDASQGDRMQVPDLFEVRGNKLDLPYYILYRYSSKVDELLNIVFSASPKEFEYFKCRLGKRIVYTKDGKPTIKYIEKYLCPIIEECKGDPILFAKRVPIITNQDFQSIYRNINILKKNNTSITIVK